ncbi:MAG: (deoxy)nucleoside triphosphate pyrophosphohydrolase [Lachnospiraceae bacterium]|nr:(deoxy)nucleoside triphosphate pyrophosphohydrolase [Lachnospiraceae bacterium]
MGGGRSGWYNKTQGAKSTVNTFMNNFPYGNVAFSPSGGIGQNGFAGQDEAGLGVERGIIVDVGKKIVEVVVALIWRGDKFLICQRPANTARGLFWEFVSCKVEEGKTKEEVLVRECKEVLDIIIKPNEEFASFNHVYTDTILRLTVFNCYITSGKPKLLKHNSFAWIAPEDIDKYCFNPTEKEILEKIRTYKKGKF